MHPSSQESLSIPPHDLFADLSIPAQPKGLVLFAHGSGSSRLSPRNRYVAGVLEQAGCATLLLDLLTAAEERIDHATAHLRFDISMLAGRLLEATDFVQQDSRLKRLPLGYFGASTGAAAALIAAAERADSIRAVVSRGGRPDLAGEALRHVPAPVLLIVGGDDQPVIGMNRSALAELGGEKRLEIIPGATHLFEEPGTLEHAAELARDWFLQHFPAN